MTRKTLADVSVAAVFVLLFACSGAEQANGVPAAVLPSSTGSAGAASPNVSASGVSPSASASSPSPGASQPVSGSRAPLPTSANQPASGSGAPLPATGSIGSAGNAGIPSGGSSGSLNDRMGGDPGSASSPTTSVSSGSPSNAPTNAPTCAGDASSAGPCRACIHQGLVAGSQKDLSCQYLGIPYAKSTAGARRFMPPEPASGWSGVRQATEFGAACSQNPDVSFASSLSEDCLYLNVYTPAAALSEPLPVMVFIHGGGYVTGSANMYSGQGLSELGRVVVVTLNYRLGVLAFFAHPDLDRERGNAPSGSDGIRDQQTALQWVHDNIASFGGDSNNVTLFGESAGSAAVSVHLVSPASRGLVHRFIMESGTSTKGPSNGIAPVSRETRYALTRLLANDLCPNATDVMACLRKLPVDSLLQWQPPSGSDPALLGAMFVPVIEGPGGVLPDDPETLIKSGKYNSGEILIGTNKYEYGLFQSLNSDTVDSLEQMQSKVKERFGAITDDLMKLYAPAGADPNKAYVTLMTDTIFRCATRRQARLAQAQGLPVYLYSFEAGDAQHANDIVYVFGPNSLADGAVAPFSFVFPASLVDAIQRYWINFAYRGDPNGPQLHNWPRYNPTDDQHVVLADPVSVGSGLQRQACDYWDHYIDQP